MKKIFITLLSITGFLSQAQTKKGFSERFSLEAGYGYVMPMGTLEEGEAQDYADFKNFVIGGHYLFTDMIGARFTYNYSGFDHPDRAELGSKYHRFTLAATYDVYGAIVGKEFPYRFHKKFDGIIHAGAGVSLSEPDRDKSQLDTGVGIQVGIQPKYYVTDNLAVFLDASYIMNLMKDFSIDGAQIDKGNTTFVTATVGVSYRFGN